MLTITFRYRLIINRIAGLVLKHKNDTDIIYQIFKKQKQNIIAVFQNYFSITIINYW